LRIDNPTEDLTGPLEVTAKNETGSDNTNSNLKVEPKQSPVKITEWPRGTTVEERESVEFSATVVGLPQPTVKWNINGEIVESSRDNYTVTESNGRHTLRIASVEKRHAGTVQIEASNGYSSDKAGAELGVKPGKSAPVFRTKLQDQSVDEGKPLRCEVTLENPSPDTRVRWYLNGNELQPGVNGVQISDNGNGTYTLSIPNATSDMNGQLKVDAANSVGSNSSEARVGQN
jgi:membrane carboxypeptidase/penicillin-binding protein PbpC